MFKNVRFFIANYDGDIPDNVKALEGIDALMTMPDDVLDVYKHWQSSIKKASEGRGAESRYSQAYPYVSLPFINGRFEAERDFLTKKEMDFVDKFFVDCIRDSKRLEISHIATYVNSSSWKRYMVDLERVAKMVPDDVRFTVMIHYWSDDDETDGWILHELIDTLHGRNIKIECDEANTDDILNEVLRINTLFEHHLFEDHGHHLAKIFYASELTVEEDFHIHYFGESAKSWMYRWDAGYEPRWRHLYTSKKGLSDAIVSHLYDRRRLKYLQEQNPNAQDIQDELEGVTLRCKSLKLVQKEHPEYIERLESARRRWVAARTIQTAWKKA